MAVLQTRLECDICGLRRTLSRRKIQKWEACLEIKRGFKIKHADICPKCQNKKPPEGRIFMRAMPTLLPTGIKESMSDKYGA